MTPHPPDNSANGSASIGIKCCACNRTLQRGGMRFPKDPELKATWVQVIMAQAPNYPSKEQRLKESGLQLCAEHFEPIMLIPKTEDGYVVYALKKGGVPTIFNNNEQQGNGFQPSKAQSDTMDVDSTTQGDDEIEICFEKTFSSTAADVKIREDYPLQKVHGEDTPRCAPAAEGCSTDFAPEIVHLEDAPNSSPVVEGYSTNCVVTDNISTVTDVDIPQSEMFNSSELASKGDIIPSLQEFTSLLRLKNDKYYEPWRILYNETSVLFTLFDGDCKYLVQSFTVDVNLKVSVFYHGQPFTDDGLAQMLGDELKLDSWTKFKKLVLFLHTMTNHKKHNTMQLKHACHLIRKCIETGPQFGCTQKEIKKWKFLLDQIEISNGENRSYSTENLQWAMHAYAVNRQGYAKIFESDVLTLPHPASLELFKRQAIEQVRRQQVARPKILAKRPIIPGIGNGLSPSTLVSNGSPLRNKTNHIQVQSPALSNSNPVQMINHTSNAITPIGQNGLSTSNGLAVEEIDCEIQEI